MAPPTMKLANRSNAYTSVSSVFDNRENCKQCQPSLNGLVSTGVLLTGAQRMFLWRNKKNIHTFWLKNILSGSMEQVNIITFCD